MKTTTNQQESKLGTEKLYLQKKIENFIPPKVFDVK